MAIHEKINGWVLLGKFTGNPWVFTIQYRAFRLKFSHHPILWGFTLSSSYGMATNWAPWAKSSPCRPSRASQPGASLPSASWAPTAELPMGHVPEPRQHHWIGLRIGWWENFNRKAPYKKWENLWFPVKIFPTKPIHWDITGHGPRSAMVTRWSAAVSSSQNEKMSAWWTSMWPKASSSTSRAIHPHWKIISLVSLVWPPDLGLSENRENP